MSIATRLANAEKAVGPSGAKESNPPVWLLAYSELVRIRSILEKHVHRDGIVDRSGCTPEENELAELLWSKASLTFDPAINVRIRELEAIVNQYNRIEPDGTVPPLSDSDRQRLERFWRSLPTLNIGQNGPRSRGIPQEDEDWRFFERMGRILPVGEL